VKRHSWGDTGCGSSAPSAGATRVGGPGWLVGVSVTVRVGVLVAGSVGITVSVGVAVKDGVRVGRRVAVGRRVLVGDGPGGFPVGVARGVGLGRRVAVLAGGGGCVSVAVGAVVAVPVAGCASSKLREVDGRAGAAFNRR